AFAADAEAEPVFGLSDDILAGSLLCGSGERGHSDQRRRNYHSPPLQAHRLPLAIGSGAKPDRQPRLRLFDRMLRGIDRNAPFERASAIYSDLDEALVRNAAL